MTKSCLTHAGTAASTHAYAAPISTDDPLRITVIGGGFTGLALVIHTIRTSLNAREGGSAARLQFDLVERNAELGRGIAYGTLDPLHRINVPTERMSLFCDDPSHAIRWLLERHAIDPDCKDQTGAHYVARAQYGAYVLGTLREMLAAAGDRVRFTHWKASATSIRAAGTGYEVQLDTGEFLAAERIALCIGHAPPALPCRIAQPLLNDPALIANPWAPGAFDSIPSDASVLIVGTGLTMVDSVVSLLARDHRGPIKAISRRGLLPQSHGAFQDAYDFLENDSPPQTARQLLHMLRRRIARDEHRIGWQPVVDALRYDLRRVWSALPQCEKQRVIKRLLPFWDVHRFRIGPQVHTVLQKAIDSGRVVIETLGITRIERTDEGLLATLRQAGTQGEQYAFDRIVFCTGPSRNIAANPLVRSLLDAGHARLDETGTGLDVDFRSQLRSREGALVPGLFAFGPITRGTFGEMTGAPDISRHIQNLLKQTGADIFGRPVPPHADEAANSASDL